jgi:hypothetical protein
MYCLSKRGKFGFLFFAKIWIVYLKKKIGCFEFMRENHVGCRIEN